MESIQSSLPPLPKDTADDDPHPDGVVAQPGGIIPVLMAALHAALWLPFLMALLVYVPRFKKIFDDFNMKLPWATHLVISVSDWAVAFPWLVVFLAGVLLVVNAALLYFLFRGRRTRLLGWVWFLLMIFLPNAAYHSLGAVLLLPLIELMDGLSR